MLDDVAIKLMAQIMQEGMTGYKIAELLNDTNKKFNFYEASFLPPSQTQERKENYANKWLSALKEKGWEQAIQYIAEQLVDKSRVYFAEDEDHPYPEEKIRRLKEKLHTKREEGRARTFKTHGKILKSMLDSMNNEELKDNLYQDIKDIESCISVGAWKAALIMAGSVLEAILSDWLGQMNEEELKKVFQELYPKKKLKRVTDYTLQELIDVAEKEGIIHGYHATICDGIRNFRNLIHPNIALRQQIKPNKATAEIGKQIILAILQEGRKIK
jgi:hypothetical protein